MIYLFIFDIAASDCYFHSPISDFPRSRAFDIYLLLLAAKPSVFPHSQFYIILDSILYLFSDGGPCLYVTSIIHAIVDFLALELADGPLHGFPPVGPYAYKAVAR